MIDATKIRIVHNYVLVRPDEDFETYQMGGKETGIIAPLVFKDEKQHEISAKQQHISISGTVFQVPRFLVLTVMRFGIYRISTCHAGIQIPHGNRRYKER